MVNGLIRWALGQRLVVLLASVALLVGGVASTLRMPVDVFPDLTAPTVTVLVEGHGMAPEEMESLVTFPIETAVNGANAVRRVRSATAIGISVVWIEFEWGTDIHRARQTVNERLATVAGDLPDTVAAPVLAPISSIMGEILFVSLTSDRHDGLTLRTTAATELRRRILAVPGVSQVTPIGGDQKQYQVVLDPPRMRAFAVTLSEVAEALREGNEDVSAGFVVEGGSELVLRGIGRVRTLDDIADTVVTERGGRPITVGDLGDVRLGAALARGTASASMRDEAGRASTSPAVILAIQKQPGANTLALTEQLDAVFADVQRGLPEGMRLNAELFRQATFIENSIHNTAAALIEGAAIVVVVVVLFLASSRASLITLLAIPMSLVVAVLVLRAGGATINTMTLGGMAIAIGALVDDAIIDVENVLRRLRENRRREPARRRPTLAVVYEASVEVRTSIVFATFIILLVFVPLFFLDGVEGRLLRPLGLAFCVSLGASLVTALTLTPALCLTLLPESPAVERGREPRLIGLLKRWYAPPLDLALRFPAAVVLPTVALFVASLVGAGRLGREFLPEFNEGALVVSVVTLPGTTLEASDHLARAVEVGLMRHPEVVAIGRRTGRAEEDEHVQGVESSELELTLDPSAPERLGLPRRSRAELMAALREEVARVPGVQASFGQPIGHRVDHMLSGTRSNIAVKVFGEDLAELRRLASAVEGVMASVDGVVDIAPEQQLDVPQLRVDLRRDRMARHGVHAEDASDALTAAYTGLVVGQVFEGRTGFDLTVRTAEGDGQSPDRVGEVLVAAHDDALVPLKVLADIYEDMGPNFISRENVERKIVVGCNVSGRDMVGVVDELRSRIAAEVELPPGYHVEYGGQFESAVATERRLSLLSVGAVVGVALLLFLMFRSIREVLLIMLNLPLALIGGVAGVYLAGGVLSVASLIGFISVFGIAARNGIMLVSHVRHLRDEEGVGDYAEAVRRGALERLAPILMTALASGLALVPIALRGDEPGTEILTPMAFVILFGLVSATLLNMLVVPALLLRFGVSEADGGGR